MAYLFGPNSAMPAVPGVAQVNYNPQQTYNPQTLSSPAISATIAPSSTSPKSQYISNKAKQPIAAPTIQSDNNPNSLAAANQAYFNSNPNVFGSSQPTQTTPPAPSSAAPNNFNGYSGGTSGVYDPYNSPAFQTYLNNYINSQLPGLTTPQIQQGTVAASNTLSNIATQVAQQTGSALNNPNLSQEALTGRTMAAAQQGAYNSAAVQPLLDLYKQQQEQAGTAYGAGLNTAVTHANYLASIAKPTAISPGQSLVLPNPVTGGANTLANVGSYGLGTGIAGQPITYSLTGGQINSGGTGVPNLGASNAVNSVAQTYGLTDPASRLALQTAVDNTLASNNDVNAAGVPNNLQPAVKAVLSQMLGSNYSPLQSSITSGITTAQTQQQQVYKSALQQGQNLQAQFTDLLKTFGLNPSDLNAANQVVQTIAKNTSDSRYQILQNYINDIANTYAQVLTPTGGSQTDTTRSIAASMLNQTASGSSLQDVMKALDNAAQAKIAGVVTTGGAGGGNNSNSSSLYDW